METSTPGPINGKWLLCILLSSLGLLLLSWRLDQAQRPLTNLLSPSFYPILAQSPISTPLITLNFASLDASSPLQSPATIAPAPSPITTLLQNHTEVTVSHSSTSTSLDYLSPLQSLATIAPPNHTEATVSLPSTSTAKLPCDTTDGSWVYDKAYPLYQAQQCPFLSDQVLCLKNGRPDSDYQHWRWEPRACKLLRFDGGLLLETLKGKRLIIVGDSLNRNEFESLCCLLYSSFRRPARISFRSYGSDYKIFRIRDYRITVEFFRCPFLVTVVETKDGKKVVKLDNLSETARKWQGADVMVFNTGHWWTHHKKFKRAWDYFELNGELVEMTVDAAFAIALKTWTNWIDSNVDSTKTMVFFRSIAPLHNPASEQWCYNQTKPITNETYIQRFPLSMVSVVEKTIKEMKTPVKYLNITRLTEYRRDAHTSVYTSRQGKLLTSKQRKQPWAYSDCSHWCLPGVPDTWNLLMYASIIGSPSVVL